jgi:hypothetical protein
VHTTRRALAAALTSCLVAGSIAGLVFLASVNAGAQTDSADSAGNTCQQEVPTDPASPNVSWDSPVSCTVSESGMTSPANVYVTLAVNDPQAASYSVNWTTTCFDNGNNQYPEDQGTWSGSITASDGTVQHYLTIPTSPYSCNATATLNMDLYTSYTVTMTMGYTSAASQATTGSSTTSASSPSPSTSSSSSSPSSPSPSSSAKPTEGLVEGYSAMCADDVGNSAVKRAKIVIWNCARGDKAEQWTYAGSELRHGGLCLNAKGIATSGSVVILWPCTASPSEIWAYSSLSHEYNLKAHGYTLCLTDPKSARKNGTQLVVLACRDAVNQRWNLP